MRRRYSASAQLVVRVIQDARQGREEYVSLELALLAVVNLSAAASAMSRALQEDAVWDSGMRRQFFHFTSGDPQCSYLRPQGLSGFHVPDFLQEAENRAVQERAAVVSELHLTKALTKWHGGLTLLGVKSPALVNRVAELEGTIVEDFCFVLMPFRADLTGVYRSAIKLAVEQAGLRCERADEITAPGVVLDQIDERIQRAQVIVADLTGANPNVTQELGYARAFEKPFILLAQTTDLPFDVRHYRVLLYRVDQSGLSDLRERLKTALMEMVG